MYYTIGAVFCIGFVLGIAFGMVRGKKELAAELQKKFPDLNLEVQSYLAKILE